MTFNRFIKYSITSLIIFGILYAAKAAPSNGALFSYSYSPNGLGFMYVPYLTKSGTDRSKPEKDSYLYSAKKYSLSAGYYYGKIQGELDYSRSFVSEQISRSADYDSTVSGKSSSWKLRAGKRFSHPGDTSYSWIYLGLKRYSFSADDISAKMTNYGYLAGCRGFYSFGVDHDIEWVFTGDIYVCSYRYAEFSTSLPISDITKSYSFGGGAYIGSGIQYEPLRISFLVTAGSEIDIVSFRGKEDTRDRGFRSGGHIHTVGFQIIYEYSDPNGNAVSPYSSSPDRFR